MDKLQKEWIKSNEDGAMKDRQEGIGISLGFTVGFFLGFFWIPA